MMRATAALFLSLVAMVASGAAGADAPRPAVSLNVASTFPLDLPLIGDGVRVLSEKIARASDGQLNLKLHGPGAVVPAAESVNAVSTGRVDAAWGGAGWLASRDSAFNFFSSVPFGPDMGEYLAWMYEGGGLALAREMFAAYDIHNIPCLLIPPEASGWFRSEIRSVADFQGLRMRFFGLGAKVMQKLGVQTVQLPPGEIPAALQGGSIDAAEFSLPVIDLPLKLHTVAKYYYFPGWHQQATLFDLYINKARWSRLSDSQREIIESACGDTMRQMIAVGEARQWQALKELRAQGVQIRRWAPEILVAFEAAWRQVASEETQANPNFRKVNASYEQFRADYAGWSYVGYLQ